MRFFGGGDPEGEKKYASAKAKRLAARKDWETAMASGDKAAAEAAEAAFMSARDAEQAIGLQAAAAVGDGAISRPFASLKN